MSYHGRNVTFGSLSWIASFTLDIWDIPHFGQEFCSPAMNLKPIPGYEIFRTALIRKWWYLTLNGFSRIHGMN